MHEAPILSASDPGRTHRVAAAVIALGMVMAAGIALPCSRMPLPANAGFLAAFGALTVLCNVLTGCLLWSQARLVNDKRLLRLAAAYLFAAGAVVAQMLTFPGAVTQSAVLGSSVSAAWLWAAWHGGFPLLVLGSVLRRPRALRRGDCAVTVAALVAGVAGIATVATAGLPLLPTILVDGSFGRLNTLGFGPAILAATVAATVAVVVTYRFRDGLSLWLSVALLAATLDVLLTLDGGGRFTLGWYVARTLSLATGIAALIALLSQLIHQAGRVAEVNIQLEALLRTDTLTGVGNRRAFQMAMATEWRRARREQTALSVLMIDIDLFKGFNDRYGHLAGDACLRQVAQALEGQVQRPADLAARFGGEEFVVLLPNTEFGGAARVAERLRASVSGLGVPHAASALGHVTVSVGVATGWPFDAQEDEQSLMDAADRALYRAKEAGRNSVCTAVSEAPLLLVA